MIIRWLPRALLDLDAIYEQILINNPTAADQELFKITEATKRIKLFRKLGRPGRWPESRELVVDGTYIVAYRENNEDIEIFTVLRAERLWPDKPKEQ